MALLSGLLFPGRTVGNGNKLGVTADGGGKRCGTDGGGLNAIPWNVEGGWHGGGEMRRICFFVFVRCMMAGVQSTRNARPIKITSKYQGIQSEK